MPLCKILARLIEPIDIGFGPALVVRDHIEEGRGESLLVYPFRILERATPALEASVVLLLGRIALYNTSTARCDDAPVRRAAS